MTTRILTGDCRVVMRKMKPRSVHCCVVSPPYWGLRDYKIPPSIWGGDPKCEHVFAEDGFCIRCDAWRGCLGLEPTYQLYIRHIVEIFAADGEVWRVMRDDGTLWLNMGDCYASAPSGWSSAKYKEEGWDHAFRDKPFSTVGHGRDSKGRRTPGKANGTESNANGAYYGPEAQPNRQPQPGLKHKDLAGMPWRVAFALQDAGWWLRRDHIWHKKNPMPEAVYDRCTTAHEYLFLLSKSGDTLLWRHMETGQWVHEKPAPEWRWRHRETRAVVAIEPKRRKKQWYRFNLWRGFDYYYDFGAIMEPSSPDSHARAARSRAKEHKHSNGSDLSGKPHGIAIGSPVAGRLPTPAGWAEGVDGHHGTIHPDGRRPVSRKLGPHDTKGPRVKNNDSFDTALLSSEIVPMRNKRSVWSIATEPFKEAHFATFPTKLVEPCILAGCPKGGTVLDCFGGSGTVGVVAEKLGRNAVLIEINKDYARMAKQRIARLRMGPEEKRREAIKASGKLKPAKGLPLFARKRKDSEGAKA